MKTLTAAVIAVAALVTLSAGPAVADEVKGKVREVLVKIDTPNGPRWFKLGADLKEVDLREGASVRFDYADDTIEAITVEEPGQKKEEKKTSE